jgi:hypothetical protein
MKSLFSEQGDKNTQICTGIDCDTHKWEFHREYWKVRRVSLIGLYSQRTQINLTNRPKEKRRSKNNTSHEKQKNLQDRTKIDRLLASCVFS